MRKFWIPLLTTMLLGIASWACSFNSQEVIEISATPELHIVLPSDTPSIPTDTPIVPTPNPTRFTMILQDGSYTVQPGDTLALIATRFNTSVEAVIAANGLANPDQLEVGQVLQIPGQVRSQTGTSFKIIPDSELVYGPTTSNFDIAAYAKLKSGFLRVYSEEVGDELWSGVEIINRVALDYSVNPRLLVALLEYRSQWLSNPNPDVTQTTYAFGFIDPNRQGLYRQMLAAANTLNAGYYGWRYRGLETTTFVDGTTLNLAPDLNAGTVAVQYFFAQTGNQTQWQLDVSEKGFFQTYLALFGDPFRTAVEPLIPPNLLQPALTLPFPSGEIWYFTGGPHGGYNTGSAWAAIDFAPPAPPDSLIQQEGYCYVSPNWATAVADGVVARSGNGYVILDLDFDGNEHTGWVVVYLHISSREVVKPGTRVKTGDRLGHPSCEGGFSTATHLHFARKYNGEWMPVDCTECIPVNSAPQLVLSGWKVFLSGGAEYQGFMTHESIEGIRRAEQGRDDPINQLSY